MKRLSIKADAQEGKGHLDRIVQIRHVLLGRHRRPTQTARDDQCEPSLPIRHRKLQARPTEDRGYRAGDSVTAVRTGPHRTRSDPQR